MCEFANDKPFSTLFILFISNPEVIHSNYGFYEHIIFHEAFLNILWFQKQQFTEEAFYVFYVTAAYRDKAL